MFRIEWWTHLGQQVRSSQTADNIREVLDCIRNAFDVRIIDERTNAIVPQHVF